MRCLGAPSAATPDGVPVFSSAPAQPEDPQMLDLSRVNIAIEETAAFAGTAFAAQACSFGHGRMAA
jgi:hypothetical protein